MSFYSCWNTWRNNPFPARNRITFEDIWDEATDIERRWILEDYLRAVVIHPDYAEVQFYDAPAFRVDWSEVSGKKDVCILMERETGLEPATFGLGSRRSTN